MFSWRLSDQSAVSELPGKDLNKLNANAYPNGSSYLGRKSPSQKETISMPISQTSLLSEIANSKPLARKVLAFYRRRLQNRFHDLLRRTFLEQEKGNGLTQKQLADRIGHRPEQINRWLGIPSNLTLNTINDLLLGMLVDLDDPSVTQIADLVDEVETPTAAVAYPTSTKSNVVSIFSGLLKTNQPSAPQSAIAMAPGISSPMQPLPSGGSTQLTLGNMG
jgi:hypothetical protein